VREWLKRLALGLCAVAPGCGGSPTGDGETRHSVVALDVSALRRMTVQGQQLHVGSVASQIGLSILESNDAQQAFDRALTPTDSVVTFPVTVEEGTTRFTAEVRSDNGTLLYTGERTADIQEDGFVVTITLDAQSPVLVVVPDSIFVDTATNGRFLVRNRGVGTLTRWAIDSVRSPQASCTLQNCFEFDDTTGVQLGAGQEDTVTVRPLESVGRNQVYTVRFNSEVGTVNVRVITR
jgi:hypothetical protein